MRDLVILFIHVIATLARLLGPGGIRSVVAESVLVKQQLLILNRSRARSPNLRTSDRLVAGLCALLIRPARLIGSAELSASTSWTSEFEFSSALVLLNDRLVGCGYLMTGLTFSRG